MINKICERCNAKVIDRSWLNSCRCYNCGLHHYNDGLVIWWSGDVEVVHFSSKEIILRWLIGGKQINLTEMGVDITLQSTDEEILDKIKKVSLLK